MRREKAVMLTSCLLVLTALTAAGVALRSMRSIRSPEEKEEEQIVDFSILEDESGEAETGQEAAEAEGELDYDPGFQEAGSAQVENPGLTGQDGLSAKKDGEETAGQAAEQAAADQDDDGSDRVSAQTEDSDGRAGELTADGCEQAADGTAGQMSAQAAGEDRQTAEAVPAGASAQRELSFGESDSLVWPIVGNVLVNSSMDKTVYCATLEQYKYNPAIIISAVEGEDITAAADGRVTAIYQDPQIGTAVVMDLGGGYELTCAQLKDLTVKEGDYVDCGTVIGKVAAPTKYFSVEGSNVYFKLTLNGKPVNPLNLLS